MTVTATERADLARVLTQLLNGRAAARTALAQPDPVDRVLWRRLAELGVWTLPWSEEDGGAGAGLAEQVVCAEACGYAAAPVPAASALAAGSVLAALDTEAARKLRAEVAEQGLRVGVLLSAGTGLPTATTDRERKIVSLATPDALDGTALDIALVVAGSTWWAVPLTGPGVARDAVPTFDVTRPMAKLSLHEAPATELGDLAPERVLSLVRTLLAAESVGVAQAALDLSVEYAKTRIAFGQPIGRFQAIKHRLADDLVALEVARSALYGAELSAADHLFPTATSSVIAKILAGEAGTKATKDGTQVHGAIACTWEHDMHLLMRRAKATELAAGSPEELLDDLAGALLAGTVSSEDIDVIALLQDSVSFAPEDSAFLAELRDFLDANWTPDKQAELRHARGEDRRALLRAWQATMADGGWAGVHWPTEYGGRDATLSQQVLYHVELAQREVPAFIGNRGLSLYGPTIIAHGTPEQKQLLVEPTRRGDLLWASGLSEPEAGSDLAAVRTRAVRDGDEFVVNGQKIWTTNAEFADWIYALVRTDPDAPKHAGITALVIPLDTAGVEVRPIRRNNGDYHFNEVFFRDVRVPMSGLVGAVNAGWTVARTTLSHEHLTNFLGAQLRQAKVMDRVLARLRARAAEGARVAGELHRRAARSWINTNVLRLHGIRTVVQHVGGGEPTAAGSITKLFGQEEEQRLYELALDAAAHHGLAEDRWASGFMSTRASTIGGGTSEIHRNKIAERVLGLPRDLWAGQEQ